MSKEKDGLFVEEKFLSEKPIEFQELISGAIYVSRNIEGFDFGPQNALFIGAHPDDIEVQAGGTIRRFSELFSCKINGVIVTDGSKGSWTCRIPPEKLRAIRAEEQKKATELLNFDSLRMFGFPEGEINPDLFRLKLVRLIRKIRPDIVITHDPYKLYELHPDHKIVSQIATEASMIMAANYGYFPEVVDKENLVPHFVPLILFFDSSYPNFAVSLEDSDVRLKLEAIKAHHSQFGSRADELQRFREIVEKSGRRLGCQYAEFFHLLINH